LNEAHAHQMALDALGAGDAAAGDHADAGDAEREPTASNLLTSP
jgi:hypothetical protein